MIVIYRRVVLAIAVDH